MRPTTLSFVALTLAAPVAAQSSRHTYFVGVQGKDTVSLEEYSRSGNTITGTWVAIHLGVFVHKYTLTLDKNGMPLTYKMDYTVPIGPHPAGDLQSETFTYGRDSATRVMVRDKADTMRSGIHDAFPVLGKSLVGYELALAKLRAVHADTGTIFIHAPTGSQATATPMKLQMFVDSAIIAGLAHVQFDKAGQLTAFDVSGALTRRAAAFDMDQLISAFVVSEAPRIAADKAAMAARVEITLPAEAFDKLTGDYRINENITLTVKRDGDKFMMGVTGQPQLQIFATSPTKFFLKQASVEIEFEVDAAGNGTAITIVQNGQRQRAVLAK